MRVAVRSVMVAVLFVAGCTTPPRSPAPQPQPQPQVNLSGFSAAFKQGYADGCEHARSLAPRKDEGRFQRDGDYAAGWNDGSSICRRPRK